MQQIVKKLSHPYFSSFGITNWNFAYTNNPSRPTDNRLSHLLDRSSVIDNIFNDDVSTSRIT